MKKTGTNKYFSSTNRFEILQDDIKENDQDINNNDPIDNNSDSSKDKEKTMSNGNTKITVTTVTLGDSILKNMYENSILKVAKFKKHTLLPGAKVDNMKHYMKPTRQKPLAQIIFNIGTNDLATNKGFHEIANEIVQLGKSAKTDKSNLAILSLVTRKDKLNAKAKEVNTFLKEKCEESNFDLISHCNIILHRYTNARGLHLNNYGERQSTKSFLNYIKKG